MPQRYQFLVFLLFMILYAIGFVVKKLQEQAMAKRARDERERRALDAIRTGRVEEPGGSSTVIVQAPAPTLSHQDATRRLQELAERRRQQLEELRRRAAAQGQTQATQAQFPPQSPSPQTTSRPVTRPTAPPFVARPGVPVSPPRPRPAPAPARAERPVGPTTARPPAQGPRRRAARAAGPAPRGSLAVGPSEPQAQASPLAAPPAPADVAMVKSAGIAGLLTSGRRRNAAELRRAILLREVLSPPVALRDVPQDVL